MARIEKQELIRGTLSKDALKLAQSLYSTYLLNDEEPFINTSVTKLCGMLGDISKEKLDEIFTELNEPIMIKDFSFRGKFFSQIVLQFCKYKYDGNVLQIELSEKYLEAMKNYMLHPFLEIKH